MAVRLQFDQVSKAYALYDRPTDRLKELLSPCRKSYHRDYWALRNASFAVEPGETLCVIGENGSGKSTLLQLAAQILLPSSGQIHIEGRTAALLELGSGFNPEFTGHDNVYLNAGILGLSQREIDERYESIIDFAGIGEFIRQPVKTYSSGMAVRLGFSVAIHADPRLLLVDEALSVGDVSFRQKCLQLIEQLRKSGVTILFVSHSLKDIQQFGTRVLWLDQGEVREIGAVDTTVAHYLAHIAQKDNRYRRSHRETAGDQSLDLPSQDASSPMAATAAIPNIDHRYGNQRALVVKFQLLNKLALPAESLGPGERYTIRVTVKAVEAISGLIVQILIRNHMGIPFSTLSTDETAPGALTLARDEMLKDELLTVDFRLTIPEIYAAHFSFSPAVLSAQTGKVEVCDWIDNALSIEVAPGKLPIYGFVHIPCRVISPTPIPTNLVSEEGLL